VCSNVFYGSKVFHAFDHWVVKFSMRSPIENFTTSYHVVVKFSMYVVTFSMVVTNTWTTRLILIKLAMQSTTIESKNHPRRPRNQYVDDEADHSIIIEYIIDYIKSMTMRARTTLIGLATNTWTTRLIIVQ
jgi:hypothetical protein